MLNDGAFAKYKEINNYYPYSEGLMPTGNEDYNKALRLFEDSNEFPIFPFFTANQADKAALNFPGSNNFSIINAQPLLQVYSAGIRNYDAAKNGYITNEQFKKLLYWVAYSADSMLSYYSTYFGITELPWDTEDASGVTLTQGTLDNALRLRPCTPDPRDSGGGGRDPVPGLPGHLCRSAGHYD